MNDLDGELRRVLSAGSPDPTRGDKLRQETKAMYQRRLKIVKWLTWAMMIVDAGLMVFGLWLVFFSSSTRAMILGALITIVAMEGQVLAKLWYWVLNSKYAILTDLNALQMQVAELHEKRTA